MAKRAKKQVLASIDEAAAREREIGTLLGTIRLIENNADAAKKEIDEDTANKLKPLKTRLFEAAKEIRTYAEKHWDTLTEDGKIKVIQVLNAGTLRRFETPASIVFDKKDEESIIKWLEDRELEQYIRRKAEVNKETLGEDLPLARQIPGVTVATTDKLVIKPTGRKERVECTLKSGRWKIVEPKSEESGDSAEAA